MSEFKDKIPAAGGRIDFIYDPQRGIATQISGSGFWAMYCVALSMDGRHLLESVVPVGMGATMVYAQPSVLAYMQSDEQGMWGRNCPYCQKYFRTKHIMGATYCPYCSQAAPDLGFISKEQRNYLTAFYDAFARAFLNKESTSLAIEAITDNLPAWHYSEEKQQRHFICQIDGCDTETDILGEYGFCPRCGHTNARTLFCDWMDRELARIDTVKEAIGDRQEREAVWEKMTINAVSRLEALGRHLRRKLLSYPLTRPRRRQIERLSFQQPVAADESLKMWFGIGLIEWIGNHARPPRKLQDAEIFFIKKMVQRRHILIHNGGIVDQDYLDLSGDDTVRLDERISIRSREAKRFLQNVREMGLNLLDNIEEAFTIEGGQA
ncbi:MAG TPA: hypothetical protein VK638_03690 [Edaphobacter sp.]|nr:hypothetical protein [Edaphobacter sp.]